MNMAHPSDPEITAFDIVVKAIKDPILVANQSAVFESLHAWIKGQTGPPPWNGTEFLRIADPIVADYLEQLSSPRLSDGSRVPLPPEEDAKASIKELQEKLAPGNFTFAHEETRTKDEQPKP